MKKLPDEETAQRNLGRGDGCAYQQSRERDGQTAVDMGRDKAIGAVLAQGPEEATLRLLDAVQRVDVQPRLPGDVYRSRLTGFGELLDPVAERVPALRGGGGEGTKERRSCQEDASIDGIPHVEMFANALNHAVFVLDFGGVIQIKHPCGILIDGQAHLPIAKRGMQHLFDERGRDQVVSHDQQKAVARDGTPSREGAYAVAEVPVGGHHEFDGAPSSHRHLCKVGSYGFRLRAEHDEESAHAGCHAGQDGPFAKRESQNLMRGLRALLRH